MAKKKFNPGDCVIIDYSAQVKAFIKRHAGHNWYQCLNDVPPTLQRQMDSDGATYTGNAISYTNGSTTNANGIFIPYTTTTTTTGNLFAPILTSLPSYKSKPSYYDIAQPDLDMIYGMREISDMILTAAVPAGTVAMIVSKCEEYKNYYRIMWVDDHAYKNEAYYHIDFLQRPRMRKNDNNRK